MFCDYWFCQPSVIGGVTCVGPPSRRSVVVSRSHASVYGQCVLCICLTVNCSSVYLLSDSYTSVDVLSAQVHGLFSISTTLSPSQPVLVRDCLWLPLQFSYRGVPKFWTHRTKVYCFCDRSVRKKAWLAASVSRRQRERRILLSLAASQAF